MMMLLWNDDVNGDDGDDHSHCHDGDDSSVTVTLSFSSFSQAYKMPQRNLGNLAKKLFPSLYCSLAFTFWKKGSD